MSASLLEWAIALSPQLLGILAFTVFVGDLRRQNAKGRHTLTRAGVFFLALGFLGVVGSVIITVMDQRDAQNQQRRIALLAQDVSKLLGKNEELKKLNTSLLTSQRHLSDSNDELIGLSSRLIDKNTELERILGKLLEESKVSGSQLKELKDLSQLHTQFGRNQAKSAQRLAEIAEDERDRKEECLRVMSIWDGDRDTLIQSGCGDFATQPSAEIAGQCIGNDGYGGPCYAGYGGRMYRGYGGACYAGYGGPCYTGYGGDMRKCPARCR